MTTRIILATIFTLLLSAGAGVANAANIVAGSVWSVDSTVAQNATLANIPGTAPDATFLVPSPLNFSIGESGTQSVAAFLTSGGAFNIVENTPGFLASETNNTFYLFTCSVSVLNGQMFDVSHDDGVTLVIGGVTVVDEPGPTSPVVIDPAWVILS